MSWLIVLAVLLSGCATDSVADRQLEYRWRGPACTHSIADAGENERYRMGAYGERCW